MSTTVSELTISALVAESYGTAKEHGWWDVPRALRMAGLPELAIGEKIALIHSEASEALEEYRRIGEDLPMLRQITFDEKGKPLGFAQELADIVIRVADLCGAIGIDLNEALQVKLAYNATREFRHGGKAC